jgi:hypothetical protein
MNQLLSCHQPFHFVETSEASYKLVQDEEQEKKQGKNTRSQEKKVDRMT